MRADVLLVERGLAPSRTAAQRLIAAGHVFAVAGAAKVALTKPSASVHDDAQIEIEASELDRFVSRGGLKLDGALTHVALDVKNFRCLDVGQSTGGFTEPFELIVADVSFISLTKVLPEWLALLCEGGHVLSLVKPQFEVGAENLARGGIVRDESLYATVEKNIRKACAESCLNVLDYFGSSITGGDGNREFFVFAKAGM